MGKESLGNWVFDVVEFDANHIYTCQDVYECNNMSCIVVSNLGHEILNWHKIIDDAPDFIIEGIIKFFQKVNNVLLCRNNNLWQI